MRQEDALPITAMSRYYKVIVGSVYLRLFANKRPVLFWLDGHYSGGDTAKGELDTPVSVELDSILESPVKGHVILIDDARCFDATHDCPHLDILLETVRRKNTYHIEVSADIIRLTPRN